MCVCVFRSILFVQQQFVRLCSNVCGFLWPNGTMPKRFTNTSRKSVCTCGMGRGFTNLCWCLMHARSRSGFGTEPTVVLSKRCDDLFWVVAMFTIAKWMWNYLVLLRIEFEMMILIWNRVNVMKGFCFAKIFKNTVAYYLSGHFQKRWTSAGAGPESRPDKQHVAERCHAARLHCRMTFLVLRLFLLWPCVFFAWN